MTPSELMRDIDRRLSHEPMSAKLLYFANHLHELTTESGSQLSDLSTVRHTIIECYHAQLRIEQSTHQRIASRWENVCPRCGHEHLDGKHCNFPMGKDRVCSCEMEVAA